jgi:alpha-galactosidase
MKDITGESQLPQPPTPNSKHKTPKFMNTTTLLVTSSVLTMGPMASEFDDLAITPPMGWNSWNLFHNNITEQDVLQMAEVLVNTGMAEIGYEYIVLDTSWQSEHDKIHELPADQRRFPHGSWPIISTPKD